MRFETRPWQVSGRPGNFPSTPPAHGFRFDGFPKDEVYFARGGKPPRKAADPLAGLSRPPMTHKWQLLANEPIVNNRGGRLWMVGSTKFAISRTITGAVLELEPGALRELHWHLSDDEWQYVLEGQASVTMFGPHGRFRTENLEKGDVGYIPQGYGHSLENVGGKQTRVLIGFNSGVYEDIDLANQPSSATA
jgi:oxalate decarboxylase